MVQEAKARGKTSRIRASLRAVGNLYAWRSQANLRAENHLWSIEGNFGWLSGLVEPGNPRGDSTESPAILRSNIAVGGCQFSSFLSCTKVLSILHRKGLV